MFTLTVSEAARLLGVSIPRVYQLINLGILEAEKIGSIWFISEASVKVRAASTPKTGRPSKREQLSSGAQTFTLMNRSHEVLDFMYDPSTGTFLETNSIYDASRAPLGLLSPKGAKVSASALTYWWKHRAIPHTREGIEAKLSQLHLDSTYELPFASFGLSLSDQYWVKPLGSSLAWSDINFFDNDFGELGAEGSWLEEVGLESPDNTSEGQLSKKWVCNRHQRLLYKGGSTLNQEPFNEVVASSLHTRLLSKEDFVPYTLEQLGDDAVSVCENFISSEEEYIPAYYVRQMLRQANHHSDYQHYIECCVRLGVASADQALAKMIVCDDLLGNTDRHWRNFGLVRNVESLEYRVAPLFDSGTSLWGSVSPGQLKSNDHTFTTKPFFEEPNRQLRLVHDYSWFKLGALDGFVEEASHILGKNPALENRIDFIGEGIQKRIDRIKHLL